MRHHIPAQLHLSTINPAHPKKRKTTTEVPDSLTHAALLCSSSVQQKAANADVSAGSGLI